jgi:hypothetical protein
VARDLDGEMAHPNADLSLRFCADDAGQEIAGVARLERISAGVATVRFEVFSGIELLAVGCASSLLLDETALAPPAEAPPVAEPPPPPEAPPPAVTPPPPDAPASDTAAEAPAPADAAEAPATPTDEQE